MSAEDFNRYDSMKLFMHHIYEFQKGVRSLVLCTMCRTCAALVCERLDRLGIAHLIRPVTENKVNLYFGERACLETVRAFGRKPLNELTPEEVSCSAPCSDTTSPFSANASASARGGPPETTESGAGRTAAGVVVRFFLKAVRRRSSRRPVMPFDVSPNEGHPCRNLFRQG